MSGFDQLRAELRAGVVRQAAAAAPVPASPRTRRWRSLRPLSVALVATLGVAGGAAAAVTLLRSGAPVPASPDGPAMLSPAKTTAASVTVLPLRTADPAGGLPWGLLQFRTRVGPRHALVTCLLPGRVQQDQVGVVGIAGSFGDDGRFHAIRPTSSTSGMCGGAARGGAMWMGGSALLAPASGYTGTVDLLSGGRVVAGCSNPGEGTAPGRSTCAADDLRRIKYGFAGPLARSITYGNRRVRTTILPPVGSSGAYLFVYRPSDAADGGRMQLSITYPGGLVCREAAPAVVRGAGGVRSVARQDPRCSPPPGIR